MSREIKFRAFDKNSKEMYHNIQDGIDFDDYSHYRFKRFLSKDEDDIHDWVVMQFTGLKDKNGKEIYEGDILKVCNGSINGTLWMDPNRWVSYNAKGWSVPAYCWNPDFSSNMDSTHWCEVIGNIHQNPELL